MAAVAPSLRLLLLNRQPNTALQSFPRPLQQNGLACFFFPLFLSTLQHAMHRQHQVNVLGGRSDAKHTRLLGQDVALQVGSDKPTNSFQMPTSITGKKNP